MSEEKGDRRKEKEEEWKLESQHPPTVNSYIFMIRYSLHTVLYFAIVYIMSCFQSKLKEHP